MSTSNSVKIKKLQLLYYLFTILPAILVGRLFQLQVVHKNQFVELCERNMVRTSILPPARGNFLDCNGNLLASNEPLFDLYWRGTSQKKLTDKQMSFLLELKFLINKDPLVPELFDRIKRAEKYGRRTLICPSISYQAACKISELFGDDSHVVLESRSQRSYPHGSLASHVLGYLGKQENFVSIGKSGLEKYLQHDLQGESGYRKHVTNSTGKQLSLKEIKPAIPGSDIQLTIDLTIQKIAEELFEQDQVGAFLVLDPQTGAIKALVSRPSFQPGLFLSPLLPEEWQKTIQQDNPFLNRALGSAYPPASLFKIVTFATALEEGIIDDSSMFTCYGSTTIGGRTFYCKQRKGHGHITGRQALAFSCNIACYEIAQRISIDQIAHYAKTFDLGEKTNVLLHEHVGFVPTALWKKKHLKQPWWKGETLCAAIGQSYLLSTPLQMARMIGSIFTGYLVKPRLLENEEVERKKLNLKPSTITFLREGTKEVVQQGTGIRFKALRNFTIFAKTGTAQTASLEKGDCIKKYREHAWFTAYFYYKNQSPLVLVALIENVGSSSVAMHAVKKFFLNYQKAYG